MRSVPSGAPSQVNQMAKTLCLGGTCVECRATADCMNNTQGNTICDTSDHTCKGCTINSDCPGSQLCKLDPSMLAAGETSANLGQCVKATDVAVVDNLSANCDSGGAGGKPYCQITQALATGKPYITVHGNGGTTANLYQPVTVSGKQVVIIGPGRDVSPFNTQQAVIDGVMVSGGAQLTLIGISVTNSALSLQYSAVDLLLCMCKMSSSRKTSPLLAEASTPVCAVKST